MANRRSRLARRRGRLGFWYRFAAAVLRPPLMLLTRRDWRGGEHLPDGGAVVVVNHVSHIDPLTFAHFVYDHGRAPRFLAKESVFRESPGSLTSGRTTGAAGYWDRCGWSSFLHRKEPEPR